MLFSRRDLDRFRDILVAAAKREVTPRFRRLAAGEVREKGSPGDLVTEADEAAERFICAELARAFPGCVAVGEEGCTRDPGLLGALADADLAFVIDPVDGTLNFASELPLFVVMAAAVRRGETVAAAIYDPISDDCALALRGEGAWLARADASTQDWRVGPARAPAQMNGMASWRFFPPDKRKEVLGSFTSFESVATLRCCGHEYRLAASGRCDFLIYGKLNSWDHAPGMLLHAEAGGCARMLDGSPYRPAAQGLGLLCANTQESWRAVRALLPLQDLR